MFWDGLLVTAARAIAVVARRLEVAVRRRRYPLWEGVVVAAHRGVAITGEVMAGQAPRPAGQMLPLGGGLEAAQLKRPHAWGEGSLQTSCETDRNAEPVWIPVDGIRTCPFLAFKRVPPA